MMMIIIIIIDLRSIHIEIYAEIKSSGIDIYA